MLADFHAWAALAYPILPSHVTGLIIWLSTIVIDIYNFFSEVLQKIICETLGFVTIKFKKSEKPFNWFTSQQVGLPDNDYQLIHMA